MLIALNSIIYFSELYNNRLSSIPVEIFNSLPKLKYFRVERNRINCDCNMVDLSKHLINKGIRVQIQCDAPLEFRERNVNDITEADLNCGTFIIHISRFFPFSICFSMHLQII